MAKTPAKARVVLIDPKNEFRTMQGSPHLLFPRAGGEPDPDKKAEDIANVISSLRAVMEERISKIGGMTGGFDPTKNVYEGDSEANIAEYNEAHPDDPLPPIAVVFDEFASISKNTKWGAQITKDIDQITALGRSVGIHCLLFTQRDDAESIPHKIQSNAKGRIHFKAAPGDTKAGKEYQQLAGDGAYIMTDGNEEVRGRGSYISKKDFAAIPAYYRDHMNGDESAPESPSDGEPPPDGSNPTDGEPPPDGSNPTDIPKDTGSDSPTGGDGSTDSPSPEGPESPKGDDEPSDWMEASSREEAINILKKRKSKAVDEAIEAYRTSKRKKSDITAYNNAIRKAEQDLMDEMGILNSMDKFKSKSGDEKTGDEGGTNPEAPDGGHSEEEEGEEEDFESPQAWLTREEQDMKDTIEDAKAKRKLKKGERGHIDEDKYREIVSNARARYEAVKNAVDNNMSYEDFMKSIEEKSKEEEEQVEEQKQEEWQSPRALSKTTESRISRKRTEYEQAAKELDRKRAKKEITPSRYERELNKLEKDYQDYISNVNAGKSDEDIFAEAEAEQVKKEDIKAKIPTKNRGKPIPGATHILDSTRGSGASVTKMPRRLIAEVNKKIGKEGGMPEGFEIDTDDSGNPLWIDGKYGFARDPDTGMYGKIYPDGKFVLSIDPTNPEFKGKDSPEYKAAEQEWLNNDEKANPEKDEELKRKKNLIGRRVPTDDQAPDNMTIVANAVANVLERIGVLR